MEAKRDYLEGFNSMVKRSDEETKTLLKLYENVIRSFYEDICLRSEEIDPDEERDWFDLSLGYFIGKIPSISIDDANTLAIKVRYAAHYWQ